MTALSPNGQGGALREMNLIAALYAEAEVRLETVLVEIDRINDQIRASVEALDGVDLPPLPMAPTAELPKGGLPPLISSAWTWLEQTRALIARKKYGNGGA
jgi:hypothetical protein